MCFVICYLVRNKKMSFWQKIMVLLFVFNLYCFNVLGDKKNIIINEPNDYKTNNIIGLSYDPDINLDGIVDLEDLHILTDNWLTTPISQVPWDLNGDKMIDIKDYAILAKSMGKNKKYKNLILSDNPTLYWKLDSYYLYTITPPGISFTCFSDEMEYRNGMSSFPNTPESVVDFWKKDTLVAEDSGGSSVLSPWWCTSVCYTGRISTSSIINDNTWVIPNYGSILQPFTFEIWIKPTSYPGSGHYALIMGHHTTSSVTNTGASIVLYPDGSILAGPCIPSGATGNNIIMSPKVNFLNNVWHIVFVKRSDMTTELWVNGVSEGTGTHNSPAGTINSLLHVFYSSYYTYFYGYIDEVAVYDYALSEKIVQEHYNVGSKSNKIKKQK